MPITTSIFSPLRYSDKEIVRLALQGTKLKIYTVASVSLSFQGESKTMQTLNQRGALVLSRVLAKRHYNLQLLALHGVPGEILWQYDLTHRAELVELKEDRRKRAYALSDGELHVICVFADEMDASKFTAKFVRAIRRGDFQRMVLDERLLQSDDVTVRGSCMQEGKDVKQERERNSVLPSSDASGAHEVEKIQDFDDLSQLSTTVADDFDSRRPEEKQMNTSSEDWHGLHGTSDSQPETTTSPSDSCICTINGTTHCISDLTAALVSVGEVVRSEPKGGGGCGIVRRTRLRDGRDVAIKTLFRTNGVDKIVKGMKHRKRFRNEVAMQTILSHPNVLPLLGIVEAESLGLGASLILPWMENSDSLRFIQAHPQVPRLPLILGTISGITFLHSKGVVHGDIKAKNVLISDDGVPLLSDFGLTALAGRDDHELSTSMQKAGSWSWMAIELHEIDKPATAVTMYSDVWAFSMTSIEVRFPSFPMKYLELLTGHKPFQRIKPPQILQNILSHDFTRYPKRPESTECSDIIWELIKRCWAREPTSRPTADEALSIIDAMVHPTSPNS